MHKARFAGQIAELNVRRAMGILEARIPKRGINRVVFAHLEDRFHVLPKVYKTRVINFQSEPLVLRLFLTGASRPHYVGECSVTVNCQYHLGG